VELLILDMMTPTQRKKKRNFSQLSKTWWNG